MKLLVHTLSTCDENVFAIVEVSRELVVAWRNYAQLVAMDQAIAQHFKAPDMEIYTDSNLLESGVPQELLDAAEAAGEAGEKAVKYVVGPDVDEDAGSEFLHESSIYIEKESALKYMQLYAMGEESRFNAYLYWDALERSLKDEA